MNEDVRPVPEAGVVPPLAEAIPSRKRYESPQLQDWGSILDLTRGESAEASDADIGGSVPV